MDQRELGCHSAKSGKLVLDLWHLDHASQRCLLGSHAAWETSIGGTKLLQIALYTGKMVLKGVLPDKMYHHFLTFSVALCILISPGLAKEYNSYAGELLTFFVKQGRALYGTEFLVYNVHSMVHLASVCQKLWQP